jgi:hypothetical protein
MHMIFGRLFSFDATVEKDSGVDPICSFSRTLEDATRPIDMDRVWRLPRFRPLFWYLLDVIMKQPTFIKDEFSKVSNPDLVNTEMSGNW